MDIVPLKECSQKDKCVNPFGAMLPATNEYFAIDRGRLHAKCKCCVRAYNKIYRLNNLERERNNKNRWRRENPQKQKAANKASYERNKDKWKPTRKKWDEEHKEKRRVIGRTHYRNHPFQYTYAERKRRQSNPFGIVASNARRRVRLFNASGSHTASDVLLQHKSQKGLCWWCGKKLGNKYHVDHRVPLARGGSNSANNICISCPTCNLSKGAKLPYEWNGRLL